MDEAHQRGLRAGGPRARGRSREAGTQCRTSSATPLAHSRAAPRSSWPSWSAFLTSASSSWLQRLPDPSKRGEAEGPEALGEMIGHPQLPLHLRLAQQDVERDHFGAAVPQRIHEVGEHRPGPGPAAEGRQALLVGGHDHDLVPRVPGASQREVQVIELCLDRGEEGGRPEKEEQDERRPPRPRSSRGAPRGGRSGAASSHRTGQAHQPSRVRTVGKAPSPVTTASGLTGPTARPLAVNWIARIPASRAPSTSSTGSSPT